MEISKIQSKYVLSKEQLTELYNNLNTVHTFKDGSTIKVVKRSFISSVYIELDIKRDNTDTLAKYATTWKPATEVNIDNLFDSYYEMILSLELAHYNNTPISIDFSKTSDYFGVTEVEVVYESHTAKRPIEYAKTIQMLKTALKDNPYELYKCINQLEELNEESSMLTEINSNMC